jgi:hypothetical protein
MYSARSAISSARFSINWREGSALDKAGRGANSYLPMSLTEWFWPNSRSRALDTIASIAARYRILAVNLDRHATASGYPSIRAGLQKLSAAKVEQAEDLRRFLGSEKHELREAQELPLNGASNWLRLKADLEAELHLFRELNQAIAQIEGGEHQAAKWLRDFAGNEERYLGDLRDLVLKCDTYALD